MVPDANVFLCSLVARKPETARVCVLPRDQARVEDLPARKATEGVEVPRSRFGPGAWSLEPPGAAKLMRSSGPRACTPPARRGRTYRGIITGFKDAFLPETAAKGKLVAADPASEALFKPYLRAQHDLSDWAS